MRIIEKKKILRVIDANLNRAKEGLRICEDIARFVLDQKNETEQYKDIRHQLTQACFFIVGSKKNIICARDIIKDVGKKTVASELKRKGIKDIFYANSQRSKESIRVLEEFTKLIDPKKALVCKKMRYSVYELERKIVCLF
ncbi:MAG: thiamine-phosphate pyrophosphorylase [Candidatus Omnitrophica bacterium]|nr:thiamine-phosphate pyrophosphorylase [Candidatus Omnitrophota bacterium]